jgi:hypothetical protein
MGERTRGYGTIVRNYGVIGGNAVTMYGGGVLHGHIRRLLDGRLIQNAEVDRRA